RPFNQQPRIPQSNQTFDSNGPNIKIRGSAHQIFERYLALAREATASDDRIAAENFYQHAEHYFRINNGSMRAISRGRRGGRPHRPQDTSPPKMLSAPRPRCSIRSSSPISWRFLVQAARSRTEVIIDLVRR